MKAEIGNNVLTIKTPISINIFAYSVFAFVSIILFLVGLILNQPLIPIGIILGFVYLYLCVKFPLFWIYTVTLSTFQFFQMGEDDITLLEVLHGGFVVGSALWWIFWMIFVKREKIVKNIADWAIIFFYSYLILNFIIAYLNGNDPVNWVREYIIFLVILQYFPIKYYINTKKQLLWFFAFFTVSMIATDIQQLILYRRTAIQDALYAFQLGASIRFKQSIFSATVIFGFLFATYVNKFFIRLLIIVFTGLTTLALIVTFSRTFWIIVLINIIIAFFYLPKKNKLRYFTNILIILIGFAAIISIVFKNNTNVIMTLLEKRFTSTGQGTKDISVQSRLQEYRNIYTSIEKLPFSGNGLGKIHEFLEPIGLQTLRNLNIHNGYLFFLYRIGAPLFFFFLFPLIYYLIKGERLTRKTGDLFYKIILLAAFNSLIMMLVVNFTATHFCSRDGTFTILFSFALINIAEKLSNDNHIESIIKQ